ncbi:hypothetical protein R69927_03282 [Paraburkholderia domus]|uniref:antiviral reverse transcriptase Drt3b n=1 Tax=Paraburkholderia domus TaxID=2793075 RepID=UPI0019118AEB|nr:antiviral reverse transcriptase Drt3b [Paraburkholderia domus]MBK5086059.1 RNA-directed DNA polymerase [Burkholderia sp. R-69927]CAE6869934.1 hypothetical protein R69927_03282 [Paraburkholderia domus]
MLNNYTKKIRKADFERIFVTETLPSEVPLMVSNDGFYQNSKTNNSAGLISNFIFDRLVLGKKRKKHYTIAYSYKIKKSASSFRKLAFPHPIAQWEMKDFYEQFEKLICHFCSRSPATITAPRKVAGTYFYKNPLENLKKYKQAAVEEMHLDALMRYSSSYFSYRGYDRLYKFFNSNTYLKLEKNFPHLKTFDVTKCFESMYTHSISWATKEKVFVKHNVMTGGTFGQKFDGLMQRANYNETNGILIGPEISRIFAEIIFQEIDCNSIDALKKKCGYENNLDYTIRRYVDDIFVFAKTEEVAEKVFEIYSDELGKFNLHTNKQKEANYTRPFFTQKSRVLRQINIIINEFTNKFLEQPNETETRLVPTQIFHPERLVKSFIDSIKTVCSVESLPYDEVSSYIISSISNRIKWMINFGDLKVEEDALVFFKDASLVLLEVIFFFYAVAPSVNASYKLCTSIILLSRFAERELFHFSSTIKQKIFELTVELLSGDIAALQSEVDGFIFLEAVNVLLAIRDLGDDYLLPAKIMTNLFHGKSSYYHLVSCLFYVRDKPEYEVIRKDIISRIDTVLTDLGDISIDTEKACLFLDVLACRFISKTQKAKWIRLFYKGAGEAAPPPNEIEAFCAEANDRYWFVNWDEVDLLSALEKKELRHGYN